MQILAPFHRKEDQSWISRNVATQQQESWNKGKLVAQKALFKLKEIWAIRMRLQI